MAKHSVLVVDDNVDAANVVAMLISAMGHETRVAHNAKDALQIAETFAFDIGIFDLGMTEMDGLQLARRVRERERESGRRARLVALTGWGRRDDHVRSSEAGFDQHWTKPADFEKLSALLGGE